MGLEALNAVPRSILESVGDRGVICRKLRITLVFTPTEASWTNPIETHFGVLGRATYAGSDDPAHVVRRQRVYRYLRQRHRALGNSAHPHTDSRSEVGQLGTALVSLRLPELATVPCRRPLRRMVSCPFCSREAGG